MQTTAKLSPEFDTPATIAQAHALLHLASALEEIVADELMPDILDGPGMSWLDCLFVLGQTVAEEFGELEEARELGAIWDQYLKKGRIRRLPKDALHLLEQARKSSEKRAKEDRHALKILHDGNLKAFAHVKTLLGAHQIEAHLPRAAVPVEVQYDPKGLQYCAATSQVTGTIRVAYQEVAHVLMGLLISDLLLAHEYLSHLVPLNRHLDNLVRENWLVVVLERTVVKGEPRYKRELWKRYRDELTLHVLKKGDGGSRRKLPSLGRPMVEDAAVDLYYQHPALFWSLTREFLLQAESPRDAVRTGRVLSKLDVLLPSLDPTKPYTITDVDDILGSSS